MIMGGGGRQQRGEFLAENHLNDWFLGGPGESVAKKMGLQHLHQDIGAWKVPIIIAYLYFLLIVSLAGLTPWPVWQMLPTL